MNPASTSVSHRDDTINVRLAEDDHAVEFSLRPSVALRLADDIRKVVYASKPCELYMALLVQDANNRCVPESDQWVEAIVAVPRFELDIPGSKVIGTDPGYHRPRVPSDGQLRHNWVLAALIHNPGAWFAVGISTSKEPGAPCVAISLLSDGRVEDWTAGDQIVFSANLTATWAEPMSFSIPRLLRGMRENMQALYLREIAALPARYPVRVSTLPVGELMPL